MRKYLTATLLIVVAIGPASALDVGLGAQVGGIGIGAGVGVANGGASAGVGTSVGGVGGAEAGASVGTTGGSSVGVSGNVGGTSGGISGGSGVASGSSTAGSSLSSGGKAGTGTGNGPGGSLAGAGSRGSGAAHAITRIAPAMADRSPIVLPRILWPLTAKRAEYERGEWGYPSGLLAPLAAIPGTPKAVVRACRRAIASAASPLGAVRVSAASAGPLLRHRSGALTAPLAVRIDYAVQGDIQARQARIRCRLDPSGRVVAVS
ncbi:helicase [Sinorhizobium glycinis]|uniref:Helicase n=1 Tax=Sinorhizobium glycinis TaxID=1472378 RepID=A0A178XND8_9HYPH|nr:hypothetical protein [Sinorhizobium glycinis]OAP36737.1 helicase [Sinorhizobium glycinis]